MENIMTFEEFKNNFVTDFMAHLPEDYKDIEAKPISVSKTNYRIKEGIVITIPDKPNVGVNFYFDENYAIYCNTPDYETFLNNVVHRYIVNVKRFNKFALPKPGPETHKHIVCQFINTSMNEKVLKDIPNRPFLDMTIIYRWLVHDSEEGMASCIITNTLAEEIHMNEEDLFQNAAKNSKELFQLKYVSMNDDMLETIDLEPTGNTPSDDMYIMRDRHKFYGSTALLYPELFKEVADILNSDLYLMPTCTQFIVIASCEQINIQHAKMIAEDPEITDVRKEDRLSDKVYIYKRKSGEIRLTE